MHLLGGPPEMAIVFVAVIGKPSNDLLKVGIVREAQRQPPFSGLADCYRTMGISFPLIVELTELDHCGMVVI